GAALAPVYPTLNPADASYVIQDSEARILFVQGSERLAGLLAVRDRWPAVTRVVLIGEGAPEGTENFEDLLRGTPPMDAAEFDRRAAAVRGEDLATLIYTSGTTGKPKGVMLSHHNIASNVDASAAVLDLDRSWTALSFLPLCHSF